MKKTINVAIGGCSFTIDEDAYQTLDQYLEDFKAALDSSISSSDVMDELEGRIADLLKSRLGGREVVDMRMAQEVVGQLGYPQGYKAAESRSDGTAATGGNNPARKLFRDPDGK